MEVLRSIRFWLITLLVLGASILGYEKYVDWQDYNRPRTPENYKCTGYKVVHVQKIGRKGELEKDTIHVKYACNQVILYPGNDPKRNRNLRKYLKAQGLTPLQICACSDSLELWQGVNVDAYSIVEDPPPDPKKGKGSGGDLSLNYDVTDNSPVDLVAAEPKVGATATTYTIQTVIGNIDSGTDVTPVATLVQNNLLASPAPACGLALGHFGQNMLVPGNEPDDDTGHGTFIGGILAGFASQKTAPAVRVLSLNIKTTKRNTSYLFDAVCGLYFGLEQGITVFNVSWGYVDSLHETPKFIATFLRDPRAQKAVIVAALGNSGTLLDGPIASWPACMAQYSNRVISVAAAKTSGPLATSPAFTTNISTEKGRMTVVAPGVDIVSLVPRYLQPTTGATGFGMGSGTSYATPFVARELGIAFALGLTDAAHAKAYIGTAPVSTTQISNWGTLVVSYPFLSI